MNLLIEGKHGTKKIKRDCQGAKNTMLASNTCESCHFAKCLSFLCSPHSNSVRLFTEQWDKLNTYIAMNVYTSNILMTTCKRQLNHNQKLEKLTKQQSIQQNNVLKWHNQCLCSTRINLIEPRNDGERLKDCCNQFRCK